MQADLVLKVPALPEDKAQGAECGGESCKLGCICSSIHSPVKVPLHCRRPECMFGCTCFKRKIMKQPSPGEPEPQVPPLYCKSGCFARHGYPLHWRFPALSRFQSRSSPYHPHLNEANVFFHQR